MSRMLLVSSDCHAAARPDDYRPYIEGRHLSAYEEWLPRMRRGDVSELQESTSRYGETTVSDHFDHEAFLAGGADGYWNFERRLSELDADGIAAEVIFPNAYNVPFDAFPDTPVTPGTPGTPDDRVLRLAGAAP